MTFKEIQDLIKLMDKSSLTEFSYKSEGIEVKIKGQQHGHTTYVSAPQPQSIVASPVAMPQVSVSSTTNTDSSVAKSSTAPATPSNYVEIKSPMVGTFYRSSSPDKPVFVNVGDTISKGGVVCIIEAMKLFNEIESEFSGKIVKVMVEDASPVEYDQVLFLVEP